VPRRESGSAPFGPARIKLFEAHMQLCERWSHTDRLRLERRAQGHRGGSRLA